MSLWTLIISLLCLGFSVASMKTWFISNTQLQEKFMNDYNKAVSQFNVRIYDVSMFLFSVLFTGLYVNFYIISFNMFNLSNKMILSFIAVFFLLQSIYNFFKGLVMYFKKEIKSSIINKLLNTIELGYIIFFIYYYVIIR